MLLRAPSFVVVPWLLSASIVLSGVRLQHRVPIPRGACLADLHACGMRTGLVILYCARLSLTADAHKARLYGLPLQVSLFHGDLLLSSFFSIPMHLANPQRVPVLSPDNRCQERQSPAEIHRVIVSVGFSRIGLFVSALCLTRRARARRQGHQPIAQSRKGDVWRNAIMAGFCSASKPRHMAPGPGPPRRQWPTDSQGESRFHCCAQRRRYVRIPAGNPDGARDSCFRRHRLPGYQDGFSPTA